MVIIVFVFLIINSQTYTIQINKAGKSAPAEIIIDNENIATCIDKKITPDSFIFTIKSVSKGKTRYDIIDSEKNTISLDTIYVHDFGIMTLNEFLYPILEQ